MEHLHGMYNDYVERGIIALKKISIKFNIVYFIWEFVLYQHIYIWAVLNNEYFS